MDQGQKGGVWKTFRVVTKDGNVLEETPLHNTTYRGKASVIQKNENAAETGESSAEAGANESAAGGQTQESAGQQETAQQQAVPQQEPSAGADTDAVVVPAFPGRSE